MGGYSSGRYRTKNQAAVEDVTSLDIRRLRRLGFMQANTEASGPIIWKDRDGRTTASINLTVRLGERSGVAELRFSTNGGETKTQSVRITGEPMRFGGWRFYFVCPRLGHRCERLAVIGGVFASRQAHRLAYASQSEDQLGRLHRRAAKLGRRLTDPASRNKPRGANRERLLEAWVEAESELDELFTVEALRRFGVGADGLFGGRR